MKERVSPVVIRAQWAMVPEKLPNLFGNTGCVWIHPELMQKTVSHRTAVILRTDLGF